MRKTDRWTEAKKGIRIMIKITIVEYEKSYPVRNCGNRGFHFINSKDRKRFIQYVAENGNSVYVISGNEIVTKDEGNKLFLELVNTEKNVKVTKNVIDANDEDILSRLDEGVDKYTEYIDNYNQQLEAEKHNRKIWAIMDAFRKAAGK